MKKYSRILISIISVAMLASMVGCSTKKSETVSTGTTKVEKVNLRVALVYVQGHSMNSTIEKAFDKFKKDHPNVTITEEFMPSEQLQPKLKTDAASNNMPDIFNVWPGISNVDQIKAGVWMNLDEALNKDSNWKKGFTSETLKQFQYAEAPGTWGLPLCNFGLGFYYNKDLFKKANVEVPSTWSELMVAISKLKAVGITPWEIGAKDTWRSEHLFSNLFYKMYGIDKASELTKGTLKYDDPTFKNVYKKMLELVDAGAFSKNILGIDYSQEVANFNNGKSAMRFSGTWTIGEVSGKDAPQGFADKVGFFRFPDMEGSEAFNNDWFGGVSDSIGINGNIKGAQKEAAIALAKEITNADTAKLIAEEAKNIPSVSPLSLDTAKSGKLMAEVQAKIATASKFTGDITGFEKITSAGTKFSSMTQEIRKSVV